MQEILGLDSMIKGKLCHLRQDNCENLEGRAEADGQRLKLIGLCQTHHEGKLMLVLRINKNVKISICQVDRH